MTPEIHIVFDGPPGPEAGRFVEVENRWGQSLRVGKWVKRGKFWILVLTPEDFPTEAEEQDEAFNNGPFGVGA